MNFVSQFSISAVLLSHYADTKQDDPVFQMNIFFLHTSCLIDLKDSGVSVVARLIQTVMEESSINIPLNIVNIPFCSILRI